MSSPRSLLRVLAAFLTAGLLAAAARAQPVEVIFAENTGVGPSGGLIRASDGNFYGTTRAGGATGRGTIYRVNAAGVLTTLASFDGEIGAQPAGRLLQASDGAFYGTTEHGGDSDEGAVFRVTSTGALTRLASFTGDSLPLGGILEGADGRFYGTTRTGGAGGKGTVFAVTAAGALSTVVSFTGGNGSLPNEGLVMGSDGALYGTTSAGGASGQGTVFKLTNTGAFSTLITFNELNGADPEAGLVLGNDGIFYGTTSQGGANHRGTIFRMTGAGVLTTLTALDFGQGSVPGRLAQGADGHLYGTALYGGASALGSAFRVTLDGALTVLASFDESTGAFPQGGLILGEDGHFYGATQAGGTSESGALFRMTTAGALTRLVSFSNPNGARPRAGLVRGSDGNFYGTTSEGGANGYGTAFRLTPTGVLTRLVSFNYANGASPRGEMIRATDGNFYGTTFEGGAKGGGTVFKLTSAGILSTLVSLNYTMGINPLGGVVQGADGAFYGTTSGGGGSGCGTVFKVTSAGAITRLASFNQSNGAYPNAELCLAGGGVFFGTTAQGGANNLGTFFKVTSTGVLTRLASFDGNNGSHPRGGVALGQDGFFYGTTSAGGSGGAGTVFKATTSGVLTTLVSFQGDNGAQPSGALVQGVDRSFYGVTTEGGTHGAGTVFKVASNGDFTNLGSFAGTSAAHPRSTPIFGADGHLYGTADLLTVWRVLFAPVTTLPAVEVTIKTATLTGVINPIGANSTVSFEYGTTSGYGLAIDAAPGTVDGFSTTLVSASLSNLLPHTLYHFRLKATSSAGTIVGQDATFTTNRAPGAGQGAANVTTGETVTLQLPFNSPDADGDAVSIESLSVSTGAPFTLGTVSGQTVEVSGRANAVGTGTIFFTVTDGFGGSASGALEVTVTDNDPPVFASVPLDRTVSATSRSGAMVSYGAAEVSDNLALASLQGAPASGSTFPVGITPVTITAKDAAGNAASVSFTVTVAIIDPFAEVLAVEGEGIPGAGAAGSSVPAGALWGRIGVPAATSAGDVALAAELRVGAVMKESVVLQRAATGGVQVLAQAGDPVPGIAGASFALFKDPLAIRADDGRTAVVFRATIAGHGVASANQTVLGRCWWNGGDTTVELLGRTGAAGLPLNSAGLKASSYSSLGLGVDGTLWATATLVHNGAQVTAGNDLALLEWGPSALTPRVVLREGGSLRLADGLTHRVTTLATLAAAGGSPGQGRWTNANDLAVRLGFADGLSAVVLAPSAGGAATEVARKQARLSLLNRNGALVAGPARWAGFGLPALDQGGGITCVGRLVQNVAGLLSPTPGGIFRRENGASSWTAVALRGEPTGLGEGSRFANFKDPVSNAQGEVAFVATQVQGTRSTLALWHSAELSGASSPSQRSLVRLAALGAGAPETGGAIFGRFGSLALAEGPGAGPVFLATLQTGLNGAAGPGGTTSQNDSGLWGVDSQGTLRLLLREGFPLPAGAANGRVVESFTVLQAVSGSPGQGRAFDGKGGVFCRVAFQSGGPAIVRVQVP